MTFDFALYVENSAANPERAFENFINNISPFMAADWVFFMSYFVRFNLIGKAPYLSVAPKNDRDSC